MGAFDVFSQIDTIRPSQFEHAAEWLTFEHIDISSSPTSCAFSGILAFSNTPHDPAANVLLVAGQITLGSSGILHVGTAYHISFTASPRSGSHQGIRQYQGAIRPIEPLPSNPTFFQHYFLAGTYSVMSEVVFPGHVPLRIIAGPYPFSCALPLAL